MNKENLYRKKECSCCGKFAFEKHLGTAKVLDGGFTRIESYEESGFGALVVNYWGIKNVKDTRFEIKLCPDCAEKIDKAMHETIDQLTKGGGSDE